MVRATTSQLDAEHLALRSDRAIVQGDGVIPRPSEDIIDLAETFKVIADCEPTRDVRSIYRNGNAYPGFRPLGGIALPGMHHVITGREHVLHEGSDAASVSGDAVPAGY